MYKKCRNEIVTINYVGNGNVEYSSIDGITYNPDSDALIIEWCDGDYSVVKYVSEVYGFITFEDGTEWNFKRA